MAELFRFVEEVVKELLVAIHRFDEKYKTIFLGSYPEITLSDARKARDYARKLLAENKSLTHKKMLDFILKPHSPFLAEGKNLLVEEFGREYGTYFSILELIDE